MNLRSEGVQPMEMKQVCCYGLLGCLTYGCTVFVLFMGIFVLVLTHSRVMINCDKDIPITNECIGQSISEVLTLFHDGFGINVTTHDETMTDMCLVMVGDLCLTRMECDKIKVTHMTEQNLEWVMDIKQHGSECLARTQIQAFLSRDCSKVELEDTESVECPVIVEVIRYVTIPQKDIPTYEHCNGRWSFPKQKSNADDEILYDDEEDEYGYFDEDMEWIPTDDLNTEPYDGDDSSKRNNEYSNI
ncbi:MAG: RPC7 family DNA-directed RNA polymerase III subunit [Promethearchaeota archaeon]